MKMSLSIWRLSAKDGFEGFFWDGTSFGERGELEKTPSLDSCTISPEP